MVASSIGAHAELVSDGESGFVIDADDDDALLVALETLVSDPARAAAMGAAGRARFDAMFDARTTTARLVDVLREVAASGRP